MPYPSLAAWRGPWHDEARDFRVASSSGSFCFVLATCVGCDHASKRAAEALLAGPPGSPWQATRFSFGSRRILEPS